MRPSSEFLFLAWDITNAQLRTLLTELLNNSASLRRAIESAIEGFPVNKGSHARLSVSLKPPSFSANERSEYFHCRIVFHQQIVPMVRFRTPCDENMRSQTPIVHRSPFVVVERSSFIE
jgi:hypothetical protein